MAVLKCSKMIEAWDTVTIPKNVQLILNPNLPPVQGTGSQGTFYDRIAQDPQILKVAIGATTRTDKPPDLASETWRGSCDVSMAMGERCG